MDKSLRLTFLGHPVQEDVVSGGQRDDDDEHEEAARESFVSLAGEDGEVDAYELKNILDSVFGRGICKLKPRPDMQLVAGNLLPVWASCIVSATSCSKLNMFNVAQLVARCDFLLLKQTTCCVDKLLILSRHATCSRATCCMSGRP